MQSVRLVGRVAELGTLVAARTHMAEGTMNNDKRIFACTALLVFIAGLLVPFVVGAMGHEELALGFLTVAEFLALLFGILSWRDRIGRVVIITQLALVVLSAGAFFLVLQPRQQRRLAER